MSSDLPPPQGFCTGEGFQFELGGSYAEVIPQKGLIPVIWLDEQVPEEHVLDRIFPEEEFVHTLSIGRNPQLSLHTLIEYWNWQEILNELGNTNEPEHKLCRNHVVRAWRPFYEATSDVYSSVVDEAAKAKDDAYQFHVSRYELQKQLAQQKTRASDIGDAVPTSTDYQDVERLIREQTRTRMENLLEKIIEKYVSQGLLITDLEEWNTEGPWFQLDRSPQDVDEQKLKTYQLIEKLVPYELYKNERYPLDHDPVDYWDAISEILARWYEQIADGESPFPLDEISLGGAFLSEWNNTVCSIVRMLDLTVRRKPGVVATSLPAVFETFNPFLIDHSIIGTSAQRASVLYPCVLFPPTHPDRYYFLSMTRGGDSIASTFFRNCYLYDNLENWLFVETAPNPDTPGPQTYIENAAQQLQEFLLRLEELWLYQRAETTCPHCKHLLTRISSGETLSRMLENRVFTNWQETNRFDQLIALYLQWLEQEAKATHRQYPTLGTS